MSEYKLIFNNVKNFIWLLKKKSKHINVINKNFSITSFLIDPTNKLNMNKTQEQLEKLRKVAELSLNKTEELQKVLAQIEALMSNTELQEVSKKKKD